MSRDPVTPNGTSSLALPVERLLRQARSLPSHEEMSLEDLGEAEGVAFLAALGR